VRRRVASLDLEIIVVGAQHDVGERTDVNVDARIAKQGQRRLL
jgi:hypothetical protein